MIDQLLKVSRVSFDRQHFAVVVGFCVSSTPRNSSQKQVGRLPYMMLAMNVLYVCLHGR